MSPADPMAGAKVSADPPAGGISPLARRMARIAGVDVGSVRGSGPGGRILAEDVLGALPAARSSKARAAAGADGAAYGRWRTDCDAAALLHTCESLAGWHPRATSIVAEDLMLLAAARAAVCVPEIAAASDSARVDLAVAVDPGGATRLIRHAGTLRLAQLAAAREPSGAEAPADPGAHGRACLVVLLPADHDAERLVDPWAPHTAALSFGTPRRQAGEQKFGAARLCVGLSATSADARAGGRFLDELRRLIEDPRRLLL